MADVLVGRQTSKRLEPLRIVVCHQEGIQMLTQFVVRPVVVALHRGVFERSVHALHLPVRPGVVRFGQAVLDAVLVADPIKEVPEGPAVFLPVRELDTAQVSERGVDLIRHHHGSGGGRTLPLWPASVVRVARRRRTSKSGPGADEELEAVFLGVRPRCPASVMSMWK